MYFKFSNTRIMQCHSMIAEHYGDSMACNILNFPIGITNFFKFNCEDLYSGYVLGFALSGQTCSHSQIVW